MVTLLSSPLENIPFVLLSYCISFSSIGALSFVLTSHNALTNIISGDTYCCGGEVSQADLSKAILYVKVTRKHTLYLPAY
jgi:hypothetical protein